MRKYLGGTSKASTNANFEKQNPIKKPMSTFDSQNPIKKQNHLQK